MKEENICMADIKNKIYEAGLFRPDERVVLTTENCVLLEHFTGKTYSYRMVDLATLKAKHLFSRQKPLTEGSYQKAIEKMLAQAVLISDYEEQTFPTKQSNTIKQTGSGNRAAALLTTIFTDILPQHGMIFRENQLALALDMLHALQENKLALCEAEVGTGKTHAYILAVTVHNLFSGAKHPAMISTSTIALQKALTEEYIPQISKILMEHRIIEKSLSFVVRKGKSHYACDNRVKIYQSSITHNDYTGDSELLRVLTALYTGACPIDLDRLPLTEYVKKRICVERCHRGCEFAAFCRYRSFLQSCMTVPYDFQIANHNLVLADVLSKKGGRKRLFPDCGVIIFDEAHKLLDTARQMYGMDFEDMELESLTTDLYRAIGTQNTDKGEIVRLCGDLLRQNGLLFNTVKKKRSTDHENSSTAIHFDFNCISALKALTLILHRLSVLFFTLDRDKRRLYAELVNRMEGKLAKLTVLLDHTQSIYWLERTGATCRICALPKQLDFLLHEDIWSAELPYILTSGTLSVGGDFTHFKRNIGIAFSESSRLMETSKASPFDYRENALLYLPADMPFPDVKNIAYLNAVVEQIAELITATHGHTLVLFTSYRLMERVFAEIGHHITAYPLFLMGKGRLTALDDFRRSRNGVLFASDSAGEGIDLAGDILSSLIVVRLPFPIPDPVSEYENTLYPNFHSYLNEVIVPGMLIKLRQWIGRGIRRETDTCVFSILDSRAHGRYRNDILAALPDMPVTDSITDVRRFVLGKKGEGYFA